MDDLKKIKNAYGEKMMHFCRDNFPTILEKPGSLYRILSKLFHPSKLLIDDINKNNDDFKDIFINIIMYEFLEYRKYKIDEDQVVTKTPAELLDEAGYILYECKTEEDIQKFRKYYKRKDNIVPEYTPGTTPIPYNGEELCTFNGGRLKRCRVFFAVKKNVDKIKREDFSEPKRQDEYGTSVISIQFANDENNTISIKNRYNHTITDKNPDATFGNNLDNIIPGLTKAFEQEYDLNIASEDTDLYDELSGYIRAEDGKYYKYNYEADNIYYCPDNIIIENRKVKQYDKSRYLLVGQLLIDFQDKTISICPNTLDNRNTLSILNYDSFLDAFSNIKSIKVETDKITNYKKIIINDNIIIKIDQTNQIRYYENPNIIEIDKPFVLRNLVGNETLEEIYLPNLEKITASFLENTTKGIKKVSLPKCKIIGDQFLPMNETLENIEIPEVEEIGHGFLEYNKKLININIPKCKKIGTGFLAHNPLLVEIVLPEVENIEDSFLCCNNTIKKVILPKCKSIGGDFLKNNRIIEEINVSNVEEIGQTFLAKNNTLKSINLPKCKSIGTWFMMENKSLKEINLPEVIYIGSVFLYYNTTLKEFIAPHLKIIDKDFLRNNTKLEKIEIPEVERIMDFFLCNNDLIKEIYVPKLKEIGNLFLGKNTKIEEIDLPEAITIGDGFLKEDQSLKRITIPKCKSVGFEFLTYTPNLKEIDISSIKKVCNGTIKDELTYHFNFFLHDGVNIIRNNESHYSK